MLPEGSDLCPQSALPGIEIRKKNTEIMGSIVGVPDPYDHASNVSHAIKVSTCKMVVFGEKGVGKLPSGPTGLCISTTLVKVLQHWKTHGEGRKIWATHGGVCPLLFPIFSRGWENCGKVVSQESVRREVRRKRCWLLYFWRAGHSLKSPTPIKKMKGRDENRNPIEKDWSA